MYGEGADRVDGAGGRYYSYYSLEGVGVPDGQVSVVVTA